MFTSETKKGDSKKKGPRDTAAEVVDIFDSLITAFILALLFITFVMQVFIIPTGSMAGTLDHSCPLEYPRVLLCHRSIGDWCEMRRAAL